MKRVFFIFISVVSLLSCTKRTDKVTIEETVPVAVPAPKKPAETVLPSKQEMNSGTITDASERIEKLSKEVVLYSNITDTEYDLFNSGGFSDGFHFFDLGPTDANYNFIVKVKPADIPKWTVNMTEVKDSLEIIPQINALIKTRPKNWRTRSKPRFYIWENSYGSISVIYAEEGIVFRSINQN
jgi:hypothetical protein